MSTMPVAAFQSTGRLPSAARPCRRWCVPSRLMPHAELSTIRLRDRPAAPYLQQLSSQRLWSRLRDTLANYYGTISRNRVSTAATPWPRQKSRPLIPSEAVQQKTWPPLAPWCTRECARANRQWRRSSTMVAKRPPHRFSGGQVAETGNAFARSPAQRFDARAVHRSSRR